VATCCEYEIDESEISKSALRQKLILLRVSGCKLIVRSSERQGLRSCRSQIGGRAENQSSSHTPLSVDQLKNNARFVVLMEVGPELVFLAAQGMSRFCNKR
jgi:hypothetical protein